MQATIRKSNKVRRSKGDVIFDTVVYIITGLMILIAIYPMYFILIASISDPALVSSGEITCGPMKSWQNLTTSGPDIATQFST